MRIKNITAHRFFLMPWIVSLLCFTVFSYVVAQENLPSLVKKIQPSVVVILTYDKEGKALAQGSGFFISKDGNIITNRHVLQGANSAQVKVANGKMFPVKEILAEDSEGDIILISADIPKDFIHPLSVSNILPEAGEHIIVIGNPLGLEQSVADGIASAVRDIPSFGKIIQITAPISPGSSGSPVVNMKGEVVGVTTFQMVEGQNLNFAIPADRITKVKSGRGKPLAGREEDKAKELYSKGLSFLWVGDYEKAFPCFEKAAKENPGDANAYVLIGYCDDKLGRYQEAIEAFKQAISIKPDYAEAHYNLGNAYGHLGRYQEAIEAYKQTIRIKPDFALAHYYLGVVYGMVGDKNAALNEYEILKDLNQDLAKELFALIYR